MAIRYWTGNARKVQQIKTYIIDGVANESSYIQATCGSVVLSATMPTSLGNTETDEADQTALFVDDDSTLQADETDAAEITRTLTFLVSELVAAINAETTGEFGEVTASYTVNRHGDLLLSIAAIDAGVPIIVTLAADRPDIDVDPVSASTLGADEIQEYYFTNTPTGGLYTLTADFGSGDEESNPIVYNSSITAIKNAMTAGMASVAFADLTITGLGTLASPYRITYSGSLANTNITLIDVDETNLTFGGVVTLTETRAGSSGKGSTVWTVSMYTAGARQLYILGSEGILQTGDFDVNDDAAALQTICEAAWGVGNVEVEGATDATLYAFYIIRFKGVYEGQYVQLFYSGSGGGVYQQLISNGNNTYQRDLQLVQHDGTGGSFDIDYDLSSFTMDHDETAASMKGKIETMVDTEDSITSVVTVYKHVDSSVSTLPGRVWLIEVYESGQTTASYDAQTFVVDDSALTGETIGGVVTLIRDGVVSAINALWEIYHNGTDGTFDLTIDGFLIGGIAYGTTATALQNSFAAVLGNGHITVGSGTGIESDPWDIEQVGNYAGANDEDITGDGVNLVAVSTGPVETTIQDGLAAAGESWNVIISDASGGTFRVGFEDKWTTDIAWGASAGTVQTAVQLLASVGSGNMLVTGAGTSGSPYVFVGAGDLAGGDLWDLDVDGTLLTGTGSINITLDETQEATGPWHWDNASNWAKSTDESTGLPVTGDDIIFDWGDADHCPKFGLDQSAVLLNSLHFLSTFQDDAQVGLPRRNENEYHEYRPLELQIQMQGDAAIEIGKRDGAGASLLYINNLTTKAIVSIYTTGSPIEGEMGVVQWRSTHADSTVLIVDGSFASGVRPGQTSVISSLIQREGQLSLTDQVSVTDLESTGGDRAIDGVNISGVLTIVEG